MVILSSIAKLDMFQIAENLSKRNMLTQMYTGFASQKGRLINSFITRKDTEQIPTKAITDLWPLQVMQRYHKSSIYNEIYDRMVARHVKNRSDYKAVLAWSGMGEHTLFEAKRKGKLTVLGRGSCHIEMQNQLLTDEFLKYGLKFNIDVRITNKELREYALADKIYVCSSFVKKSFLDRGFSDDRIFVNPIAVPTLFSPMLQTKPKSKFIILFLGKLTIQKGSRYLFQALEQLNINENDYEAWFIGAAENVILKEFNERKRSNWKYIGFVPQAKLPELISQADLGVFPSIQDGFAQVVPQQLSCGVPVITTFNTGSSDFIQDGYNGYVVPACNSETIAEKVMKVFKDSALLSQMKINAVKINSKDLSIDAVANRFEVFFKSNT